MCILSWLRQIQQIIYPANENRLFVLFFSLSLYSIHGKYDLPFNKHTHTHLFTSLFTIWNFFFALQKLFHCFLLLSLLLLVCAWAWFFLSFFLVLFCFVDVVVVVVWFCIRFHRFIHVNSTMWKYPLEWMRTPQHLMVLQLNSVCNEGLQMIHKKTKEREKMLKMKERI